MVRAKEEEEEEGGRGEGRGREGGERREQVCLGGVSLVFQVRTEEERSGGEDGPAPAAWECRCGRCFFFFFLSFFFFFFFFYFFPLCSGFTTFSRLFFSSNVVALLIAL